VSRHTGDAGPGQIHVSARYCGVEAQSDNLADLDVSSTCSCCSSGSEALNWVSYERQSASVERPRRRGVRAKSDNNWAKM
jgi:hypothetical protein